MKTNYVKIQETLYKELGQERYEHTIGVMYTATALAMRYGVSIEQARLAGLLHDCAKAIPNPAKLNLCKETQIPVNETEYHNPSLLHAKLGAYLAKTKYDIEDDEILHAIEVHTTGAPAMSLLDKIVFIADYIEPNRKELPNLSKIREMAFLDIDSALLQILTDTLAYLATDKKSIDPMTQQTYDYYYDKKDR